VGSCRSRCLRANTNQIYARLTTAGLVPTSTYAAGIAWAYDNNSKTDWYLPSKDELNQMCKWQRGQAWVSDATICNDTGTPNSGRGASGFSSDFYWSSSENAANDAWLQYFDDGSQDDDAKTSTRYVRSVRAFG